MTRAARLAALAAVVVAALAGCVRVSSETALHSDDTFSQHLIVAMTDAARTQVASAIDMDLDGLREQIEASSSFAALAERYPDQIELTDYSDGDLNGFQLTMQNLPLAEYQENAGDLTEVLPGGAGATIERVDDTFVVTMASGGTADGLSNLGFDEAQLGLVEASVDIGLTFTFPGLVQSASAGEINGNSVTLRLRDLASESEIVLVGGANDEFDWAPLLLWGGIGLAIILVVGGATALVVQDVRRRRKTALPPPDAAGTSGIGTLDQGPPGDPDV